MHGLLSLISMGQGISLLPNYAEQMLFRNIVTRPLDDDSLPEIPLLMAWRREDEHVPMHRFMRELVHDIFNNPPLSAGLT